MTDLVMTRGDNAIFEFHIVQYDGTPVDLTGAYVIFVLRDDQPPGDVTDDSTAVLVLTTAAGIVLTDAENGIGEVRFVNANTYGLEAKDYWYGIKYWKYLETEANVGDQGVFRLEYDYVRGDKP